MKSNIISAFRNTKTLLSYVILHTGLKRVMLKFASTVFTGITPFISLLVFSRLLNTLQNSITRQPADLAFLIAAFVVVYLMQGLLWDLDRMISERIADDFRFGLEQEILRSTADLEPIAFENQRTFDQIHRLVNNAPAELFATVNMLGSLLPRALSVISLSFYLARTAWYLPFCCLAVLTPAYAKRARYWSQRYLLKKGQTNDNRRLRYCEQLLLGRKAACELRCHKTHNHILLLWKQLFAKVRSQRLQLDRSEAQVDAQASLVSAAVLGGALFWVIINANAWNLSLGLLAAAIPALLQLIGHYGELLWEVFFVANGLQLTEEVAAFSSSIDKLCPVSANDPSSATAIETISLKDVEFYYPDSKTPALRGVNLRIDKGSRFAIVGPNGSGKTTLVKLLMGMYPPSSGSILINDRPLERQELANLRKSFAAVFQDFWRFEGTVADNVLMGCSGNRANEQELAEYLERLCAELSCEQDTLLGKESHNGTDLSSGQWQRIAIARAMMRDAPIVIFDEPTSFLDPAAEDEFWRSLDLSQFSGKTVLFVSHRTAVSFIADFTIVLNDGQIVETGPAKQLLSQDGYFKALYEAEKFLYGMASS